MANILLIAFYLTAGVCGLILVWRKLQPRNRAAQPNAAPPFEEPGVATTVAAPASPSERTNTSWSGRRLFSRAEDGFSARAVGADRLTQSFTTRRDDYIFGALTPVFAAMLPDSQGRREETAAELQQAGYYQPHALENLAAVRYLGVALSILVFGSLMVLVPSRYEGAMLGLMVVFMLSGWAVPRLYVKSRAAQRKYEIETALPDMLDMLHMCVSQGLTIQAALNRVATDLRRTSPALATELAIVCDQAKIGTIVQALTNFARRLDIADVHSFVALVSQTESMGTSISAALMEYSDGMRESLRQRADQKANQASFKLLFPTVLCLMPAVYIFLLGPAIVELTDFFGGTGQQLLDTNTQTLESFNVQSPQ